MTIQTKLDALMLLIEISEDASDLLNEVCAVSNSADEYSDAYSRWNATKNAVRHAFRTLLEENERLRAAAQAVVDAANRSEDLPYCVIEGVDSLEEALK